ncbi:uncharacterized protein LOC131687373 [Topomyia yanbarensis]|uniref:uncharacterized protein LOC131687373 n=1 Tax=Topomyia yanbarensis TaxID=2498891 RepID=UPI00273C096D|nr:uncharacterized protein LOC131687373 [Topomyia yanbarensis]
MCENQHKPSNIMAEEEDKETRYEKVWNRVKVYIPFLQELISFYKNDTKQNRQQQLQKITTMYDLLTNQRLNYASLCKCEGVLIKLYETNALKKKPIDETSASSSGESRKPMPNAELETPASPCEEDIPDEPENFSTPDKNSKSEESHPAELVNARSKPPLSLDEIQRLIMEKPGPSTVRPENGNNLSKAINDTLKILSKDFHRTSHEEAMRSNTSDNSFDSWAHTNVPHSPTYPPHLPPPNRAHSSGGSNFWDSENDSFGSFPHSAGHSYHNVHARNYNNIELPPRPPKSPPLYRRRDDLPMDSVRFNNDRMDISPMYSPPSEIRSPPTSVPSMNSKDPRLRKPTVSSNDPRLNRINIPQPQPLPGPVLNELPKCVAPNPNLPLELPKKDQPKRRLSICANQVIIEEIPPEPTLPNNSFPVRRQSITGEFGSNDYDEPFHGSNFYPPSGPVQPTPNPYNEPFHGTAFLPTSGQSQLNPAMLPSPTQSSQLTVPPHSNEISSVADRDPRRKLLQHSLEYINQHPNFNQQTPTRFDRPPAVVTKKAPLTYLEYRRQKEEREKQMSNGRPGNMNKPNNTGKPANPELDITIGMVPNKSRVAAKAYAKPVKFKDQSSKERRFAPPMKDKSKPETKNLSSKPQKNDHPSSANRTDKKRDAPEKEKQSAASKAKDLFGEQLSQFDKMYRTGDFSKKAPPTSVIGSFKIPKIKRVEKSSDNEMRNEKVENNANEQRTEKSLSKSPEPAKNIVADDDMWDAEETNSTANPQLAVSLTQQKVAEGPTVKASTADDPKNKSTMQNPLKTLVDDDLWDDEAPVVPKSKDSEATKEIEPATEKENKESDGFQIPGLPAPRRIIRRRNSVASHDTNLEKRTSSPVPVFVPTRITRRRNSIAIAQLENDHVVPPKGHSRSVQEKKKAATSGEVEEDIVRPRKPRKRKVIIDDDDEEENVVGIVPLTSPGKSIATQQVLTDGTTEAKPTVEVAVDHVATASVEEENNENVVSSTTNEAKSQKTNKKRKGRGKNPTTSASDDATTKELVTDISATDKEPPVEESSHGVSKSEADEKEKPTEKETDKEAKEEKENKELVENIMSSSSSPDNKTQLLAILSKMLDEKKLKKVQEIIESPSDKSITCAEQDEKPNEEICQNQQDDAESSRERTTSTSVSSTNEMCEKDKSIAKKKNQPKRSELDKLNADIAEMYIRDGVLNATGRRSCTKKTDTVKKSPVKKKLQTKQLKTPPVEAASKCSDNSSLATTKLKKFNIVVKKIPLSEIDKFVRRKRKLTEESVVPCEEGDDAVSVASTISPKSKKKKKSCWATGIVPKKKKKLEPVKQTPPSPVKSYSPKPVTKNISRELHCKNEAKSTNCALCSYTGTLSTMVQHYVRNHPLHEVYVSRVTNSVANKLKKDPIAVTGSMNDQNITFQCIFCQEVLTKKKYNWKLHLASHTGEYRYKCNNCTIKSLAPSTQSHDPECSGPAMEVINELMFEENHIYGYMCRLCNYVQLSRTNMFAHLKEEHDRKIANHGTLQFSILNYEPEDIVEQSQSQETLTSDISMPELTPQTTCQQTNLSAFISSASDEIESLKVLNDRSFVSPSKPSIIDKLKQNFDEIMRNENTQNTSKEPQTADDDEWEDIDSPTKNVPSNKVSSKDKVRRSLVSSTPTSEDIPMPTPLALKEEQVDIFEGRQLVANMAFNKIREDKTWYLCMVADCKYATEARPDMYRHVKELHCNVTWDGYCYLCTAQVVNDEISELAKEIKHMAVVHMKDHTAVDELLALSSTSIDTSSLEDGHTIKLRRFSGDKLSIGTPAEDVVEDPIKLKPWIVDGPSSKNRSHSLNMLEQKSLFCFYKCMGITCCFTTTLETQMSKHLDNHELVADVSGPATTKSWLECAYCDLHAGNKVDLMKHLHIVHSKSVHQCAYCFYRSRDAYSIVLHQKLYHEKDKRQILLIPSEKQSMTSADLDLLNRRRLENILPLICTVCKAEYCGLDAYMTHLKVDHADLTTIACQCCSENVLKPKMPRHLLLHKIGIYECMYCQFGSNTMEAVQTHVCNRHPDELFYCCVRHNKTPGKTKEASLQSLCELPVDDDVFVFCQFRMEELNYKSPDTKSNREINFSDKPQVIPLQLPPIRFGDTNILLSAQIPSTSADSIRQTVVVKTGGAELVRMPTISGVSGGIVLPGTSSVPIITAVQGNYQEPTGVLTASHSLPVISHVAGGFSASSQSVMPVITRVEGGVVGMATIKPASSLVGTKIIISPNKGSGGVPIITNVCSIGTPPQQSRAPTEDEALMLEAERVAMEMIKDTGLPKSVIYKCVFKGCNSVLADGTGMRKHLTFSHMPSNQYACVHCKGKPSFPNVMAFTQHLKTHEAQRIFCFMCDYKGSFPPEVIKHVKDVHKTNKPTILFLNPKKNDPNNDIILFAPGQPAETEKKAFYKKLIEIYNHKLQAALNQQKTHFAPEECENLPKQAIFSQMVYCSSCQYCTKVRLNMFRHLKGHLNDMPVSNVDPKNPVPCWGQGEKHFDRMRNPAASSQEDDDLIQSLCFVQENKRYICGAADCRYLTINETMLRNHLSTLHADAKDYKCPHCPAVHIFSGQLNVSKLLEHLKLHDKELYRCSKCGMFLNNKNEMDRHINEKHSTVANVSIFVIRDGSTAGSVSSVAADDEVVFKWKCDVCKFKSVTISEMRAHMQETHNINAKYRCSRCLYSCSNKSLFSGHFEKDHPGCEIVIISMYKAIDGDDSRADTTPLWRRETSKTRSIRGIMVEVDENEDDETEENIEENISESNELVLSVHLAEPGSSGLAKRKSTESSVTNLPAKRPKQDESIIKAFKCGIKGCDYVNDFGSGIVAHFKTVHPNDKPSVLRNALACPEQSRFDYFMKYACFYCVKKADTLQELLQHWRQLHKMSGRRSQDKPFLFRTAKIILCFYCRKGAVMPEMKSHFSSCHPGQQPIYLDFRNPKRCAECDFVAGVNRLDMVKHFAAEHKEENEYAKGWIDYLSNDVLDKILSLNSFTYGCEKCDFTTENNSDFNVHYGIKHPGQKVEFNEFAMEKKVIYYCSFNNCKREFFSEQDMAQHILQHVPPFKCLCNAGQCVAQFRSFTMLLQHFQTTHPHHTLQYALKTPDEYTQVLRMVTIQFWNGFVMTLEDARQAGNRYGSYEGLFKIVDEICAESVTAGTRFILFEKQLFCAMTTLTINSAYERIFNASLWQNGSIKKSSISRCKKRLCTRRPAAVKQGRIHCGALLIEQLDACYEELSIAIMAELDERERINQELREKVHQQLDAARVLIESYQGSDAPKKLIAAQHAKLEGLVTDRNKRLKSDTLRKLLGSIEILINKVKKRDEAASVSSSESSAITTSHPESPTKPEIPQEKASPPISEISSVVTNFVLPCRSETPEQNAAPVLDTVKEIPLKETTPIATTLTVIPAVVSTEAPAVSLVEKPSEVRAAVPKEIISEEAKFKQKPQIPWRTPLRLEPLQEAFEKPKEKEKFAKNERKRVARNEQKKKDSRKSREDYIRQEKETATRKAREQNARQEKEKNVRKERQNDKTKQKQPSTLVEPVKAPEPERLALRYKPKKRPAEDEPANDTQFKKPFPKPSNEPLKPLFQRRHQLSPVQPVYSSKDPRNYGEYCQRQVMQMQNRARFESQNQQYYRQRPPVPVAQKSATSAPSFAVPAPTPPTLPLSTAKPYGRPPAPKASVSPMFARPPPPKVTAVRPECKKTINPVYASDEPIRLGKKEPPKKFVSPAKSIEKPKEDLSPKADETTVDVPKLDVKNVEEPAKNVEKSKAQEENKKSEEEQKNTTDEKDNELNKELMDLLKVIGDEEKVNRILNVMNDKSDDETEEKSRPVKKDTAAAAKETATKNKKYKRIRSKLDESSSEDESNKKDDQKKEKSKTGKLTTAGSRELNMLIENSSEWMSKGAEIHHSRRRGTSSAQNSASSKQSDSKRSSIANDLLLSSDEEDLATVAKKQETEEESLLTVVKVAPVLPKGKTKSKTKETTFVYNDKKQVHYNSNYSSNCALCSFNGSAIVDHYVYEHKQYEVFVSRVSPKMADIIRTDPFLTNGLLLNEGTDDVKIRFKCFFCLSTQELSRADWTAHLTSHTGEYRYRCTSCPVMSQTEELASNFFHEKTCLKPSLVLYNNIEFQDNHMYGFMCNVCNYIQIRRVNMERHLKREHPSADITCSRFSIVNYKIETKPIIDEDQLMADMASSGSSSIMPAVMIPLQAKDEPMEACEIVNQPFTEDDEQPLEPVVGPLAALMRRADIRLNSVHIGPAGVYGHLEHRPFSLKFEQELQADQVSSSGGFYESPMSPEPALLDEPSEAQAVIPIMQIESVEGGFEFSSDFLKRETNEVDYESDASNSTTELNMSDATEEGQQGGQKSGNGGKNNESTGNGGSAGNSGQASGNGNGEGSSSTGSGSGTGGAAGAGGDDGDKGKKGEFPTPVKIKVEKEDEDEQEKKKQEAAEQAAAFGTIVVKTEKPDEIEDQPAIEDAYDFVELVLDSTRIEHVAYLEHQSDILHLCLMPGCQYISKKAPDIVNHVSKRHSHVIWDGYCHPCQSQIVIMDNCTIANELQHLLEVHARRKTPTQEVADVRPPVSNVIRIRKMPGDTLSAVESNPPPLTPIMSQVAPIVPGPSTIVMGQQGSRIIQSGATMGPIALGNSTMITPTHTIPAQIRPIASKPTTTVMSINNSQPAPVNTGVPSMANLRISTVRLKPWTNMVTTKNQEHCRNMLEEISLLCLYKCMARSCAFTTNNRFFMDQHLNLHESRYVPGPSAPRKCWLECAYCELIAPNCNMLLIHIDSDHSTCGFQCNLCFYRSRDPTNVVVHQKTYHPTPNESKKILIMPDNLRSFGDDEWRAMQDSLRKNVLPLHCTICKESYYILSAYMTHLAGHTQGFVCCQVCNLNIDKKSMARHLLLHSIGLYECVYCLFGANTKSTMALHVSNAHCSKPLYCCVRYNKKRPDGVDYPPNKIESMELKTMSCTVSPDLFKRCNYTPEMLNYKPIDLNMNQIMSYPKPVQRVVSNAVATPAANTSSANPGANIQIQITDEAGRPLIISIPVQNSAPVSSAPPPPITQPLPGSAVPPTVQMPMITTVQGGVPVMPQPAPLPVISSVQGMATLPPLTAIQRNDSLPIISSVQSVAQPPNIQPAVPPKIPTLTAINAGGMVNIPNIPGITITAKPVTTCGVTSSSSSPNVQSSPAGAKPMVSLADSISSTTPLTSETPVAAELTEPRSDMYTTTVAEADTQSANNDTVSVESDDELRTGGASKCSTPVPSQSPGPGGSKDTSLTKKFSSTTQIRIDFLFKGNIERFDQLEKKVSQMIKHTGFYGQELNVCGVDKCTSRFTDPVKLNLHLLKHHNVSTYKCFHCNDRFKTAHELITHIKAHGRHRYMCFLCDRKSHFLKMMILHVQHDHNSTDVILTYLHPKKRDIHNDLVVICPQNVTSFQLQSYIDNILKEDGAVVEKKHFSPSEIDQLPPQDIYLEDVFCSTCDYSTKIRKNLKRHLERHLEAPGQELTLQTKQDPDHVLTSAPVVSNVNVPQMIAPVKLYQCGICKFDCPPVLADFRAHLFRTHRQEKVYKCSHCEATLNDGFICIDKIVNHLKLHGENLYKCSECDFYRDEKHLITAHVKHNHAPGVTVTTIREAITSEGREWQCDLCETIRHTRDEIADHMTTDHKLTDKQFKCSLCSYKSSDYDTFKVHFSSNHPKSEILIISLYHELPANDTRTIKTDGRASVEQSVAPPDGSKKKKFSCGSDNCSYSSTDLEWAKRHFLTSHPDQTLVVYDESITEKEKRKRFDYFVKYVCNHCQMQCDTIDDVVEHWCRKHKDVDKSPLMYKLFKLVRCFYCDKLSSYYDIKMHATVNHPGQTFACVDHQNVFKCGECPFVLTGMKIDLLKHFKIYHSASKTEDPCDYIDDEFLHRMLEQNNSLYTCNHCKIVFSSRFEYENHIDVCSFAGLPASFTSSSKSVRIRYICSCCNDMFSDEYSIAKHMRTHLAQYNCRYCKREFKQLSHLDQHQMVLHNAQDNDFILKDLNQYRNFFLKIKMLFPNGLLLSKVDAYRTVCGSVEDIINYARSVNDEELNQLMYNRAVELPLRYVNDFGETAQTTCKEFLASKPKMILDLENLDDEQLEQIKEQVYLLAVATGKTGATSSVAVTVKRKRGRPKRYSPISSNSETDDQDDDDWQPGTKRMNLRAKTTKSFTQDMVATDSESDDDFLINLKKERL